MGIIRREGSALLIIDFQGRLMPAIHEGAAALANARRLIDAAAMLGVPMLTTEQNPKGLGGTVQELAPAPEAIASKMTFDANGSAEFRKLLPAAASLVVAGCEAHVCVLQTVLGLIEAGRKVHVVRDAIGSRRPESKETALARMERHGADIVTTEMVVFEWLGSCEHTRFREAAALIR
jgi:nicotinamidase-related amidase